MERAPTGAVASGRRIPPSTWPSGQGAEKTPPFLPHFLLRSTEPSPASSSQKQRPGAGKAESMQTSPRARESAEKAGVNVEGHTEDSQQRNRLSIGMIRVKTKMSGMNICFRHPSPGTSRAPLRPSTLHRREGEIFGSLQLG